MDPSGNLVTGLYLGITQFRAHQKDDRITRLAQLNATYVPPIDESMTQSHNFESFSSASTASPPDPRERKESRAAKQAEKRRLLLSAIRADLVRRRDGLAGTSDMVFCRIPGVDETSCEPHPPEDAYNFNEGILELDSSVTRNHTFLEHELWVLNTLDAVCVCEDRHKVAVEEEKNSLIRELEDEVCRVYEIKYRSWRKQQKRNISRLSQQRPSSRCRLHR